MQADLKVMVRRAQQGEGGVEHGCAARGDAAAAPDKQGRRHAATRWRMEAQRAEHGEHAQQARARACVAKGCGTALFSKGPAACCRQAEALYWVMYYWVTVLLVFGCKIRERGSVSSFSPPFPAAAAAAALSATTVDNCTLHAAAPCLLSAQTAMDAS